MSETDRPAPRRESAIKSAAVVSAIVTAVVGPVIVLFVARMLEPGTVKRTKEGISTITVSDNRVRDLSKSVVYVEDTEGRGATGFVWDERHVVTTSRLAGTPGGPVGIVRRKSLPGERRDLGRVAAVDTTKRISVIDAGRNLRDAPLAARDYGRLQVFDKVFALVYAGTDFQTLREGRVLSLDKDLGAGRHVTVIDMPIELGMAGAPVFNKDGEVVGMITGSVLESRLTYLAPVEEIEFLFEAVDVGSP